MGVSFEEVLDEFGWKDGFRIPVANEENQRLETEIEQKSKKKARLLSELERSNDRIKAIEKHAANLETEHSYKQKLITAHAAQFDTEDHLARLTFSDAAAIVQEIRNLEKEKNDIQNKNALLQIELAKVVNKIERSKRTLEFDKEKLNKLEEYMNHEGEKSQKIEFFIKIDAKHFKNLQLERERLAMDLESYKRSLIRAVDDVTKMEIMLDRTAKFYVQTLKEQFQLISCWKQSVFVLKQRDNGIQDTLREIDTLRELGSERMEVYREAEQFLNNQANSNKDIEDSIRKLERKLAVAKEQRSRNGRELENHLLELKSLKNTYEDLKRRTRQMHTETKRKKTAKGIKSKKAAEMQHQIEEVRSSLDEIGHQTLNAHTGLKQLEEMIEMEEKRRMRIAKETSRFQTLILRTSAQTSDLEDKKKILDLQKQGELKKAEVLAACIYRDEKLHKEKKRILSNLEIDIEKCEMRLERATGRGDVDRVEIEKKEQTIVELGKVLNDKIEVNKLLQEHIASLEHNMRKVSNSLASDKDELERLRNKKQDLLLLIKGGEKKLKSSISENEEKQVEESILSLRVSQAERLLTSIDDKLYNLDKYRLQIDAAMKERRAEIRVHREAVILEKRLASNDCAELRAGILERKTRVQNLQTRYDISVSSIGSSNESGRGSPLTTTYLITQRAQEKFMLQEQGDKLDATIRTTEKEIRCMENTLRVVNACNDKYKVSLGPIDDDSTEQTEKRKIEDGMYKAIETMRQRREQLQQIREDIEKMRANYRKSLEDVQRAKEEKDNKLWNVANLERQITEQNERILRADKSLRKLFRNIQHMCECTDDEKILLQEKDIATCQLQEQNLIALHRITELTIRHVEIDAYLKNLLASKNIILPCAQHLKPTPTPSRCDTSEITTDRASLLTMSRESIGRVHNIETVRTLDKTARSSTCKYVSPTQRSLNSTATSSQESQGIIGKHFSCRNK